MIVDPNNEGGMIVEPAAFSLMLITEGGRSESALMRTTKRNRSVELASCGSGSARYIDTDVDDTVDGEWVTCAEWISDPDGKGNGMS